jgi:hypothetical protein
MTPRELLHSAREHRRFNRLAELSLIEQLLSADQLAEEYDGAISNLLKRKNNAEYQSLRSDLLTKDPAELSAQDKQAIQLMLKSKHRNQDGRK